MAMKIGNADGPKGVGGTKRKKSASGAGSSAFADQLRSASGSEEAHASEGVVGTNALDGVDALLAMQEVGDSTEERNRKQARKYGMDLLDRLGLIQDALLRGGIPKENLMQLAKRIREGRANIQDPRLSEILDEIELRAEVEIAKYTRSS